MGLSLFEHNQTAYHAAIQMMDQVGKAAVIHPTGTGKSFLGFHLAMEHPDQKVCWLSPSDYIFRTQLENIKRAVPGYQAANIQFLTYAKLMGMALNDIAQLAPDFIILDEFHRCGAEQWGKGVDRLLRTFPKTPLLGLSATGIRYLDHQRNMADELFDGHIASEMSLGEAIVRNIILPPKYVICIYSYKKELEQYQKRVDRMKNTAAQRAGQQYLDTLRHALEHAEGLDLMFQKHMAQKNGKYIVFCSSIEHLNEMKRHVPEWFSAVDPAPHVYAAYSQDPDAEDDFIRFTQDNSCHLKLLFCIDMLNEGIHLENISGVILFRPTISPIIYYQQIGRALSAGQRKQAVIFDVVNNFDSLYSIGAIQEEMRTAVSNYHWNGETGQIVNERFQIIDQLYNCKDLFHALQRVLQFSWTQLFQAATEYYAQNGHLNVPKRYKTADGLNLGAWIATQRRVRSGQIAGTLTASQIQQLDEIGMQWEGQTERSWRRGFEAAQEYYAAQGNLDVPVDFVTPGGVALGRWIVNVRQQKAGHLRTSYLTQERIQLLNSMGMIWDKFSYQWEQNYLACANYYLTHGNLNIPANYVSASGLHTGAWVRRMRQLRTGRLKHSAPLTEEQIRRLDAIGMDWTDSFTKRWEYGYQQALSYYQKTGHLQVPAGYINESGFPLGKWLRRHTELDGKTGATAIRLTPERKEKLSALGMVWESVDQWEKRLQLCQAFYADHGHLNIPQSYVVENIWLGKWLYLQKRAYWGQQPGATLTPEQITQLEQIGMDWRPLTEQIWEKHYKEVHLYMQAHPGSGIPKGYRSEDGTDLTLWLQRQWHSDRRGQLPLCQQRLLHALPQQGASSTQSDQRPNGVGNHQGHSPLSAPI